ncbi:hypothetical protein CAC42_5516 [Sphaceloma murrayae]|uniref:Pyruvate decarboxylase n=1 Tax=Sphaceloma murrayae TaxID=2082308 RepID=A0A2K1QYD3_9PEZI|nr:hypothetical protein CAC42_5516 [Sphaceloma murrayae]
MSLPEQRRGLSSYNDLAIMSTIALGEYLWRRDYLATSIYSSWTTYTRSIGTANELNASYAADGYARIKNVPGCIVTTHGVGELSALNGIAGSLTEQVKVIHIVGQTTRPMQVNKMMIHHSIGFDPDHQIFNGASKRFRVAEAELWDAEKGPAEIDRVIRECFIRSGPVYIFIPLDLVDEHVPADLLNTPIDTSPPSTEQTKSTMQSAVSAISQAISAAKNPVIYVDALLVRHNAVNEARELIERLGLPIFTSGIGMGIVNPSSKQLVGLYWGQVSSPGVSKAFEESDLLLVFGRLPSDTNTGGFSQQMSPGNMIDFKPDRVDFRGMKTFSGLYYKSFLPYLSKHLTISKPTPVIPKMPSYTLTNVDSSTSTITTPWFWPRFASFLQPGDSILADTGTSLFGLLDCTFPSPVIYNTQTYYGSIGYATPATLGADLARQELAKSTHPSVKHAQGTPKRTVLVTGDGSIQLTIQELGTMIHYGANPVIVLINNNGYTVERIIHGAKQGYNDIVPYDFSKALAFFGMSEQEAKESFVRCETKEDFERVLGREDLRSPKRVMIVEVVMDAFDAPWRMLMQIAMKGEETKREMVEGGFVLRAPVTG